MFLFVREQLRARIIEENPHMRMRQIWPRVIVSAHETKYRAKNKRCNILE